MIAKQISLEEQFGLYDLVVWEKFMESVRNCKINLLKELVRARSKGGKIVTIENIKAIPSKLLRY